MPWGGDNLEYIGKLNRSIYEKELGKLQTDEVVLTNERKIHIKERHPSDYELINIYGAETVENPNIVMFDNKNAATVLLIKKIPESNISVIVRLALENDIKGNKNSVITFHRLRERHLKKLLERNKILYIRE